MPERVPSSTSGLPAPSPEALAHSEILSALVRERIAAAGGWISFRDFMRLALYAPGLGYYVAGSRKIGSAAEGADFVTSPELTPLFGHALANQIADVLRITGGGVLELGAGSGKLAADVLVRLAALCIEPVAYSILEPSPELRERQRATIARIAHGAPGRIEWIETLPAAWTGVIFGNEVLDALPVELLARRDMRPLRRGVAAGGDGRIEWSDRPLADTQVVNTMERLFPPGDYESEINIEAEALTATLANILRHGMLLWIDYGFPAREYYHPQRADGTVMCHYRHHAHGDPLLWPGLQDITAHVDFSAIASAATDAGLDLAGYASQASFLIDCEIAELLQENGEAGAIDFLRASNAMQRLLSPAEMGELFKVIAFTRGIDEALRGFRSGDRSGRL